MKQNSSTDKKNKVCTDTLQTDLQFITEYKADKRKSLIYFFAVVALLIFIFIISFTEGRYNISVSNVVASIFSGIKHSIWRVLSHLGVSVKEPLFMTGPQDTVIWRVRMPRIFAAILVGSSLSVSGATYQGLFRNP